MHPKTHATTTAMAVRQSIARFALPASTLLFGYVLVFSAWMGDDPFITFRSIDNCVNGYGLTWNPYERVQVFTHPLWMLLLLGLYAVFHDAFYTTLALSMSLSLGVVLIMSRALRGRPPWVLPLFVVLLVSSKAFVDYSTSGLENPLSHVLATLFFSWLLFREGALGSLSEKTLGLCVLLVALAYLNRPDSVLVYAPALGVLLLANVRRLRFRVARAAALGMIPAIAWSIFATVYYGFPLPNTAYAKLNGGTTVGQPLIHKNAIIYLRNSLEWDPLTIPLFLATMVLVVGIVRAGRRQWILLAPLAGGLAYFAYIVRIGGDYMSGRFFALPYLLACIVLARLATACVPSLAAATVGFVVSLLGPRPPIATTTLYIMLPNEATGIRDERGHYHEDLSLLKVVLNRRSSPGNSLSGAGDTVRSAPPKAMVWGAIGYFGFSGGPDLFDIDNLGLSDPLIARIAARYVSAGWGRGHLFRSLPVGYVLSVETSQNRIVDPSLHVYYDKLLLITTGPIFRWERFRTILEMNTGKYGGLVAEYNARASLKSERCDMGGSDYGGGH